MKGAGSDSSEEVQFKLQTKKKGAAIQIHKVRKDSDIIVKYVKSNMIDFKGNITKMRIEMWSSLKISKNKTATLETQRL